MALSTLSPTLILLGTKGIGKDVTIVSPDVFRWALVSFGLFCLIGVPWALLAYVQSSGSDKSLDSPRITEAGDHMLVYALAVVLPLWDGDIGDDYALFTTMLAFFLVWFLVASSNLHHANVWLRLCGYRFFQNSSPDGSEPFFILSRNLVDGTHHHVKCKIIDSKLLVHSEDQK